MIASKSCSRQYIGSTAGSKERFQIDKRDISTDNITYGVPNHLLNVGKSSIYKNEY